MGANKTKLNKNVLQHLTTRTNRSREEIKTMYAIFRQHFRNGKIESPEDLWRCLHKFSPIPINSYDPSAAKRLYRLFDSGNQTDKPDGSIDFFQFMIVSNILERGTANQKIGLYFASLDVNNDNIITRDDLEKCLPNTVESRELSQQLLRQWDMNRDGVVSMDDFERYIMTNPDLLPMFADPKDRLRMDSVTFPPASDHNSYGHYVNTNHGTFVTSQ